MFNAGCDLHKQTITVCIVDQSRQVMHRQRLKTFAETGPNQNREQRELLRSIPGVGFVTAEIVRAELADIIRRNRSWPTQGSLPVSARVPGNRRSARREDRLEAAPLGGGGSRLAADSTFRPQAGDLPESQSPRAGQDGDCRRRLLTIIPAILKNGQLYSAIVQPLGSVFVVPGDPPLTDAPGKPGGHRDCRYGPTFDRENDNPQSSGAIGVLLAPFQQPELVERSAILDPHDDLHDRWIVTVTV